jgi:hypothetical protein
MADRADKQSGACWPSTTRIAEDTELDVRTVRKHLRHLEKAERVKTEKRITKNGQTSNYYTLNLRPPPAQDSGGLPESNTGGGGVTGREPRPRTPAHIEPSIKPLLNPDGVAPACQEGARRLAEMLGAEVFNAWFGDAVFDPGPPVTIRAGSRFKAIRMEERFRSHLEQAFGDDVVVIAPRLALSLAAR